LLNGRQKRDRRSLEVVSVTAELLLAPRPHPGLAAAAHALIDAYRNIIAL